MTPKFLIPNLKLLFAAHHFVFNSKDPKTIADVLNVKKSKIQYWMKSYEWIEAVSYWRGNSPPKEGDLGLAETLWTEMIKNNEHLSSVNYPDKPIRFKQSEDVLKASAMIHSHLFCVDGLCDEQIHARLAEEREFEGEPVRYREQYLGNAYYWWILPNASEGLYSKVLARANVIGDLVIGSGEDICLVIIRHDRLTLSRQVSDDVANVSDERLLVCL